jgi:hypothetical protein
MARLPDVKTVNAPSSDEDKVLVYEWADGVRSVYDLGLLSAAIIHQAARHGIVQKLSDAHAGVFKATGSVAECREKSDVVWENFLDGDWSAPRTM